MKGLIYRWHFPIKYENEIMANKNALEHLYLMWPIKMFQSIFIVIETLSHILPRE